MTTNLFETAISKNEINDFFRGKGEYFVPSPDYEGHVHGANMGGHARSFADHSELNSRLFDEAFLVFLKSLSVSKEDLSHLLANLSSYFGQKSRGGFSGSYLFCESSSSGSILVRGYLEKIDKSSFIDEVRGQVRRHATFIHKKGSNFLADIIHDLVNV